MGHDQAFEIATSARAANISPFAKLLLLAIAVLESIAALDDRRAVMDFELPDQTLGESVFNTEAVRKGAPWVTQEKLVQLLPLGAPQLSFDEYLSLMNVLLRGLEKNVDIKAILLWLMRNKPVEPVPDPSSKARYLMMREKRDISSDDEPEPTRAYLDDSAEWPVGRTSFEAPEGRRSRRNTSENIDFEGSVERTTFEAPTRRR